jgi:hypothetical protein
MNKKLIRIKSNDIIEYYITKTEVAKKFNYTSQHIGKILNKKIKKNYIVFDDKILYIEYELDENIIKKYIKNDTEKRSEYNKKAYLKKQENKNIN